MLLQSFIGQSLVTNIISTLPFILGTLEAIVVMIVW